MLGLFSFLSVATANDVLLPHFTPSSLDDIGAAERFEQALYTEINNLNVSVVSPQTLDQEFPNIATSCADTPTCPPELLSRQGATLLIVGSIEVDGGSYNVLVRFYGKNDNSPLEVRAKTIAESEFSSFVSEIAQDAAVFLELIPTHSSKPVPTETEVVTQTQVVIKEVETKEQKPHSLNDDPRLRKLPKKLRDDYLQSPKPVDEWMQMQRIRAGNVLVETHLGVSFGDVIRRYDTRLGFMPNKDIYGIYEYDAFITGGPAVNLGVSIGYAPLWWLELSIYGGVLIYNKELNVGWEQRENSETVIDSYEFIHPPSTASAGDIEPKVRIYMVPNGPVKPYVLAGGFIRIYDGYTVPDSQDVNYSNRPEGVHFGAMGGAGLAFDSQSPVGVFLEIPYVFLFNNAVFSKYEISPQLDGYQISNIPTEPSNTNQIVSFKVGMSLRFQ